MSRNLYHFLFLIVLIIFNYFTISSYLYGDQEYYRLFYEGVREKDLSNILIYAKGVIGSSEIIYPYIAYTFSILQIDKDLFITFFNLLFLLILFKSTKNKKSRYFLYFLLVFNFYFLVLFYSAERLKFGFFFCFICIFYFKNTFYKFIFFVISLLCHFQMLIFWYGYFAFNLIDLINKVRILKYKYFILIFPSILILINLNSVVDINGFLYKFFAYFMISSGDEVYVFGKAFILFIFIFFITKKYKINHTCLFIFMLPIYYIFGGDRINIIYLILSLIFLLKENEVNYIFLYILLFYYIVKGFFFLSLIYTYGSGF